MEERLGLTIGARKQAISNLLRLHMLFRPISSHPADSKVAPARKVLSLAMDDAIQYRCAGAIQAAIERQTDIEHGDDSSSDASSDLTADDDAETAGDGKKQRGEKNGKSEEACRYRLAVFKRSPCLVPMSQTSP